MRIFKFGGASVKDAAGVNNVLSVLEKVGYKNTLLVISAMGKSTNALELIIKNYLEKSDDLASNIQELKDYHGQIISDLFGENQDQVNVAVNELYQDLEFFLGHNKSPDYSYVYDQIIGCGELLSTTIISHYLNYKGLSNNWLDVRGLIKTDSTYRDAAVDWEQTQQNIVATVDQKVLNITQGFLGSDANNFTTSLGREGSDYTAAIFAYCLDAESVSIWKDVPGVMNADPRVFDNAILLNQISYREAIELAFYGASVIHPKTLQPLQRKEIPLYVKSFVNPELPGTSVSKGADLEPFHPCFILKRNQLLISLSSNDFSFIVEDNISEIFALLHKYKMKVSLIQNSAISFSVCVEDKYGNKDRLYKELEAKFAVTFNEDVSLYTVRHYNQEATERIQAQKTVLLKQFTRDTLQIVAKA
ncbi:MAG: aspartate kinase [Flavobacteriales bacterium]|nr:aspartate kinase [Flavobacteriales bacterium]